MLALQHTRELPHFRPKPDGVYRIVVLGDSMARGFGVLPRESLPAHLQRLLHSSIWDRHFEVINCGQDGRAVYEMGAIFSLRGRFYTPDLVVLVLCDNDALFFRDSRPYDEQVRTSWRDEQGAVRCFQRAITRLTATLEQLATPLEVAFYYQRDNELRTEALEVVRATCRRHDLGFVDLSADFTGGAPESDWDRYRASPADAHPSSYSHQIAARALARHLIARGHLSVEPTRSETAVLDEGITLATASVAAGAPATWTLARLCEILEDKRRCAARHRLQAAERLADDELDRRQAAAKRSTAAAYRLDCWRGILQLLDELAPELADHLQVLDKQCQLLGSKNLFLLELRLEEASPSPWPTLGEPEREAARPELTAKLVDWAGELRADLEQIQRIRRALAPSRPGDEPLAGELDQERRRIALRLDSYLTPAKEILAGYLHLVERCLYLAEEVGPAGWSEPAGHHLADVILLILGEERRCSAWASSLLEPTRELTEIACDAFTPWTRVSITAGSRHIEDVKSSVQLAVYASVPVFSVVDHRHLILDGASHTYHFEIPTVSRFHLEIALDDDHATLQKVQVVNRDTQRLTLHAQDLFRKSSGVLKSPALLVPP